MPKVLIPTKLSPVSKGILEDAGYSVVQCEQTPLEELIAQNPDTTGLIVRSEKITADVIDALPELKVVVRAGAGYNTIDTKHARKKGVAVMNTPGANSNAVAEEVIGLILATSRHFLRGDQGTRDGLWEKGKLMGQELTGKTVGILGFGNIGQLLATRLKGFENEILVFDPFVSAEKAADFGAKLATVEEIFAQADFISLHIPATPETTKMINKDLFAIMKDGATIINCARCEVLDEDDLREAKKTKKIVFCNDVYPKDIAGDKSVKDICDIMLPHLGASTIEANTCAATKAANQLIEYLEKGVDCFVVNKTVPAGLDAQFQELAFTISRLAQKFQGDNAIHEIQATFYGKLKPFDKWLTSSIVAGIDPSFDMINDYKDAASYLETKGIKLVVREGDEAKNYGESITIDLLSGTSDLKKVSIRGTVTEGNLIVSRVQAFDKLYFEPSGKTLIFSYQDRPGVLAELTQAIAYQGINIEDIRSPHNKDAKESIALIKVNDEVSNATISTLKEKLACTTAFYVSL